MQLRRPRCRSVELNEPFVAALEQALERARRARDRRGQLTPGDLLRLPHARDDSRAARRDGSEADEGAAGRRGRPNWCRARWPHSSGCGFTKGRISENSIATPADSATSSSRIADAAANGQTSLQERLAARIAELTAELPVDRTAMAAGDRPDGRALRHQRGSHAVPRAPGPLDRALRRRRAMRPEAGLSAAGDEPRDQHHRLQGRRPGGLRVQVHELNQ